MGGGGGRNNPSKHNPQPQPRNLTVNPSQPGRLTSDRSLSVLPFHFLFLHPSFLFPLFGYCPDRFSQNKWQLHVCTALEVYTCVTYDFHDSLCLVSMFVNFISSKSMLDDRVIMCDKADCSVVFYLFC